MQRSPIIRKQVQEPALMAQKPKFTTIRDVVKILDITHVTLDDWRKGSKKRKKLPYYTLPVGQAHRVALAEDDVEAWLTEHKPELLEKWKKRKSLMS